MAPTMMEDSARMKEMVKDFGSKGSDLTTLNPDLVADFHPRKQLDNKRVLTLGEKVDNH
jgi:hypothetical protein